MKKQQVALFCSEDLLGEGVEHLLSKLADVEILGPWIMDETAVVHLAAKHPDIVIIAGDSSGDELVNAQPVALLTAQILEHYVGLPVVQILLDQNQVRVYNSHTIPARSTDLIEAIRRPWSEA